MSSAGQRVDAGRIPGERIATTTRTSDTSTFTTSETVTDEVEAPLVSGRTYRVVAYLLARSSVANDTILVRLREDDVLGTQLRAIRRLIFATGTASDQPVYMEAEFTASSTEDKTFVATAVRASGTGNITFTAGATNPVYLYVEYVSG